MSTRFKALEDAIDILLAAYNETCPDAANCEKCALLGRVMNRVNDWLEEEIDAAAAGARAKAQAERVVLDAALQWREADAETGYYRETHAEVALAALRQAVDEYRKGE